MTEERCPYCPPNVVSGGFNTEHVIPAKLGGTLTIRTHSKCNEQSALAVDNRLMADPDVEVLRALAGVSNTRTNRAARGSQTPVTLADGARALVRVDPSGHTLEQVGPGEPQRVDEHTYTFTTPPTGDIERWTERALAKIQAENPGRTVTFEGREARRTHVEAERSWGIRPSTWPRFAAKVALALLDSTLPETWHGSAGELALFALFRNDKVIGAPNGLAVFPTELHAGDGIYDLLRPWEHLLSVQPSAHGVVVSLMLFGELRYDLDVQTELRPTGSPCWLLDHRESKPFQFATISEMGAAVATRLATMGEETFERPDRPRRRILGDVGRIRIHERPDS